MAVERFLSIKFILWRKVYFNEKRAVIVCLVVFLVFFCSKIPILTVGLADMGGNVTTTPLGSFYTNGLVLSELEVIYICLELKQVFIKSNIPYLSICV